MKYILFILTGCVSIQSTLLFADGLPLPDRGRSASCKLSPIQRPVVYAAVDLQPGVSTQVALKRRVTLKRKRSGDGRKLIEFNETGELAVQPEVLNQIMARAISAMRSKAGETCQFSISTFGGSASWSVPPTFRIFADGKGRKCTRFEYPCGPPEVKCEIRWDFQKCETWMKMCESRQVFDIANWSVSATGRLPITVGADTRAIDIQAVRDTLDSDSGGSGEVARILEDVGLVRLLQNLDTSLKIDVNFDLIPSIGRLLSIAAPTDPVASPKLVSAAWTAINNTEAGRFSNVGISYSQYLALPEKTGCDAIRCLRKSKIDEDYAKCVLSNEERKN